MTQTSTAPATDTRGQYMSDEKLRGLLVRYNIRPRGGFLRVSRERLLSEVRHHNLIERTWSEAK